MRSAAYILTQRVCYELEPELSLIELTDEPSKHGGLIQTFDVRLGNAITDDVDDYDPTPPEVYANDPSIVDALVSIAKHRYGVDGCNAAAAYLEGL